MPNNGDDEDSFLVADCNSRYGIESNKGIHPFYSLFTIEIKTVDIWIAN